MKLVTSPISLTLFNLFSPPPPLAGRSDLRLWFASSFGFFYVSSFFSTISSPSPHHPFPHRTIWFSLSPSKVQAFLWNIAWNRGSALDIIQAFYPHLTLFPNCYPLRLSVVESNSHLFLHCQFSWRLWGRLFELVNLSTATPASWTCFLLGTFCVPLGAQGSYGIFAYMALFGRFGMSGKRVSLRISVEIINSV